MDLAGRTACSKRELVDSRSRLEQGQEPPCGRSQRRLGSQGIVEILNTSNKQSAIPQEAQAALRARLTGMPGYRPDLPSIFQRMTRRNQRA